MHTLSGRIEKLNSALAAQFKKCLKKPIPVKAIQIQEAFRVDSMEGDYKQGKAGDYLMCGVFGELYICDKDVFEASYDWVD